ncbi:MAG: Rv2578c family radical SAM protein [Herbiconiux sp.]|nr:Rv2578c family radical SAM protein [Herbiconiux sp.]
MRWNGQSLRGESGETLPGLARVDELVRVVQTPEFAGITFHEVLAKSALNHVSGASAVMPNAWTVNPYRGCSHACVYCFARPTHSYLEFDAGDDFDRQIVVKVNVAEVLRRELARPSWKRQAVALGTNTDPYQRAEGRYALMPGIIEALTHSGTPFSVLTKGSLLRRDLDLIAHAAETVPVSLAFSIAVFDDELQQSIEPGTPSARARLATVTAVRERGLDCQVFLMPVLPLLTDSREQLDHALGLVAASGATSVVYSALHLKPGVKEWFLAWLGREHPELVGAYGRLYSDGVYAPKAYREWLTERARPLLRKHGLNRSRPVGVTGHVMPPGRADDVPAPSFGPVADSQPMLF